MRACFLLLNSTLHYFLKKNIAKLEVINLNKYKKNLRCNDTNS